MKWLRHRKARSDRGAGLAFAWRASAVRFGSTLAAVVLVGLVAATMAAVVKVRVLMPPARSGQRGTLMLAREGDEALWLARRGAELTPFPAPLDVHGLGETERALANHPALGRHGPGEYVPRLREWPAGAESSAERVGGAGLRELPPLPELPKLPEPVPGGKLRSRPVLIPDSAGMAVRVPVPLPDFELAAGQAPPDDELRFLLELGADGRVQSVAPLGGVGAEAGPVVSALDRWLRAIRFEPVEGGAGWFTVAVGFVFSGDD